MSFLTDSIIVFSKQEIKITIHINIFLPSNKEECYFEMGILTSTKDKSKYGCGDRIDNKNDKKTTRISEVPTIKISLPIKSDEFQFEDLSNRFIENPDYLRLIFNQSSSINENKEFEIEKCKVIFGKIDNISDNTITLKLDEDKSKNYYFRFRLKDIKKKKLCLEEETTSFVIDPFKRFINVAGFHINNIRNNKNRQLDLGENQIAIQEINTFFICDVTTTLIDSSIPKRSFRLLEENTWEAYMSDVNKINDSQKRIIYQFKKIANEDIKNIDDSQTEKTTNRDAKNNNERNIIHKIKDFKLFVKTSHIDGIMRVRFLVIIILIAISANALYGMLTPTFSDLEIILTIILSIISYKCGFINFLLTKIKNLKG